MRIKYEHGNLKVDVIEKNGEYFGKWDFNSDDGYILIEVKLLPYHNLSNETLDKTFTFGGFRFWFRDVEEV